jgi:hypothetical protein
VRAGYASVLASRALGRAPVLRPARPSRFEPEGRLADVQEVAAAHPEVGPLNVGTPTAPGPVTVRDPTPLHEEAPLLDWREPDDVSYRIDQARARHPGRADTAPPADRPARPFQTRVPDRSRPILPRGVEPALWDAPAEQPDEPLDARRRLVPDESGPVTEASVTRAIAQVDETTVTRHTGDRDRLSQRTGPNVAARGVEPVVVVHIGRLDVRAVQPPSSAPELRRVRPAGPTLEDRLAARDRAQK